MSFKLAIFAAFVAVARAGVPLGLGHVGYAAPAYSAAPAVSYSYSSSPLAKVAAAPVAAYAAPAYAHAAYAPAISHASYAPAISHASYAPAISHASYAPAISHASYAPAISHASYAPAISHASYAPAISHASYAPAISHASYAPAQVASYAHALPSVAAYAAPYAKVAAPYLAKAVVAEPVAPAVYDFGYSVSDPHTGDSKSQQESRRGDQVQGSYSLIEADGSKRIVEYVADDHNGFNAVVHREPAAVAVKAVAPVSYAAPVVAKYASPALYHH